MNGEGNWKMPTMKTKSAAVLATMLLAGAAHASEVTFFSHSLIIQSETTYEPAYSNTRSTARLRAMPAWPPTTPTDRSKRWPRLLCRRLNSRQAPGPIR